MSLLRREYYTKIFDGMFFAQMKRYSSYSLVYGYYWGEVIRNKSGIRGVFRSSDYSFTVKFVGDKIISVKQNPFAAEFFFGLFALAALIAIIVLPIFIKMTTAELVTLFTLGPLTVIVLLACIISLINANWKKIEKILYNEFACYSKE